jgi:hypothetical protein
MAVVVMNLVRVVMHTPMEVVMNLVRVVLHTLDMNQLKVVKGQEKIFSVVRSMRTRYTTVGCKIRWKPKIQKGTVIALMIPLSLIRRTNLFRHHGIKTTQQQ